MTRQLISRILFVFFTASLFSCMKKEVALNGEPDPVSVELQSGFGQYYKKISGFFFVACVTQRTSSTSTKGDITGLAAISDPPCDLMRSFNHNFESRTPNENRGNISVAKVTFNDHLLTNASFTPVSEYHINNYVDFDFNYTAKWTTEGNGPFEGFTQKLDSFPKITVPNSAGTVAVNQPFAVNVKKAVRHYDSVSVIFRSAFGKSVVRSVGAPDSIVL